MSFSRLNQVPVVRSPSITSSHLNAVAPLVKVKRINSQSDAETLYKVQVTSVVPPKEAAFKGTPHRGLKVFSDRQTTTTTKPAEPKSGVRPGEPIYAEPKTIKKEVIQSSIQPKSKGERLEEQRKRRELRKQETLTTTPNIRTNRPSIFDSLTSRRRG